MKPIDSNIVCLIGLYADVKDSIHAKIMYDNPFGHGAHRSFITNKLIWIVKRLKLFLNFWDSTLNLNKIKFMIIE